MKKFVYIAVAAVCMLTSCCQQSDRKVAGHVIYIGLDGWGSYSVPAADMPNVKALMEEGCYTLQKRTVLPSSSAVNWASMFMGAGPELHGYTDWGSQTPDLPSRVLNSNGIFPTVFSLCRETYPESEIGVFYEWDGIKYLVDTLALSTYRHLPAVADSDNPLCAEAERYIVEKKPVLAAFCFDEPDHVGHTMGHDTPEYYAKMHELDTYVGRIIEAAKAAGIYDDCIFIVTSDHGGVGRGHGGKTMMEMETPFIIAGRNVRRAGEFSESMMQYDVASTIAYILALNPQPQVWIGRPFTFLFE